MTHTTRKILALFAALIHLGGSIGYAGMEHYCRMQHQQTIVEQCCCTTEQNNQQALCCGQACGLTPETAPPSDLSFHNSDCCELVSLIHRVEETATSAPSLFPHIPVKAYILLPTENNGNPEIKDSTLHSHIAPQLTLPLLI